MVWLNGDCKRGKGPYSISAAQLKCRSSWFKPKKKMKHKTTKLGTSIEAGTGLAGSKPEDGQGLGEKHKTLIKSSNNADPCRLDGI